jgi:hypothetical protein
VLRMVARGAGLIDGTNLWIDMAERLMGWDDDMISMQDLFLFCSSVTNLPYSR